MSKPDIKKYGLEFINDLADDRKIAVQSLGVVFSAVKSELRQSKMITRPEEYQYFDDIMKQLRDEVNRNFESQLTRITIKSWGWIKRVLMQGEKILILDESQIEELQQTITDLTKQLKIKSSDLVRIQSKMETLEEELTRKENELQGLRVNYHQKEGEFQQEILSEKKSASILTNKVEKLEDELFGFQQELEEKIRKNDHLEQQITHMNMDIVSKTTEIERLNNALEQARTSITATDDDVSAAMQQWAVSYQQQEEHFQKTLEETKAQYEELIKSKMREISEKNEQEINELKEKIGTQESRERNFQDQISGLELDKQDLLQRKEQLEELIDELTKKNVEIESELKEKKKNYDQLQDKFEDYKVEAEERVLQLQDIQLAKIQNKAEWLEQCLSFSNFSPLVILLRMGNEMTLKDLASAVGMDPIVLENQLQHLHRKDLVDIRSDGKIVAKIPISEYNDY